MGTPGTFPCLFGGEPSPLPASSRWQAWFGGSSWLSPISPMQRQGKPMRSMPRGSRQPSGGWVFWPFRRQAKRARHVFRKLLKGIYSKETNTQKSLTEIPDIKIDNVGKCWEINGVPVGVFCRLTIQGILWALHRSWKVQGKSLKKQLHPSLCTTGHHRFDGRAQLSQVGDEEVSLFFALDSEGSTCPRAKWPHHRILATYLAIGL